MPLLSELVERCWTWSGRQVRWSCPRLGLVTILIAAPSGAFGQDRVAGTATIRADGTEYVIPIECRDAARPELGFSTEPARITREARGRTSPVRLEVRRWQDTDEIVVTLDRYVAWAPMPSSSSGVLTMDLEMSPASSVQNGLPVLLTYDRWTSGERPTGTGIHFEATCRFRDPAAPSSRRVTE